MLVKRAPGALSIGQITATHFKFGHPYISSTGVQFLNDLQRLDNLRGYQDSSLNNGIAQSRTAVTNTAHGPLTTERSFVDKFTVIQNGRRRSSIRLLLVNTLRHDCNSRHFANDMLKCIIPTENVWYFLSNWQQDKAFYLKYLPTQETIAAKWKRYLSSAISSIINIRGDKLPDHLNRRWHSLILFNGMFILISMKVIRWRP